MVSKSNRWGFEESTEHGDMGAGRMGPNGPERSCTPDIVGPGVPGC